MNNDSISKQIYSATEAAKILGIHRNTVIRYCNEGEIKGRKLGRKWLISKSEIEKLIK